MIAARIHSYGGPEVFRIEEIPEPEVGPLDLIIRQRTTSVNALDIWLREGRLGDSYRIDFPAILGIDFCGEVVDVGPEVSGYAAGDRVVVNPYVTCGHCDACLRQQPQKCANVRMGLGSYTQLACVPAARAVRIDDSVSGEAASCFANTYFTAWEMLVNKARVLPGDSVFIWAGTSGLGSAALDIAKLLGATVIATAGSPEKLAKLSELGADLVLDHHRDDVVSRVQEFTSGNGASVVFEHTGSATWRRSIELVSSGGTVVIAGVTTGGLLETDGVAVITKQVTMMGSRVGTMAAARAAVTQLNRGRLKPLIGATFPLSELSEAHRLLGDGGAVGKVVIDLTR